MKTLVIGAGGFVGEYLLEAIQEEMLGEEIIATMLPGENMKHEKIHIEELDISNPMAILQLLEKEKPDYIINLAAQNSILFTWENPGLTVDINIKGCINILDAVRQVKYQPRILLIGSGEEYGKVQEDELPINERVNLNPYNIYGATKACQNLMAEIYVRAYDMQIIMARAFNYIGPGQTTLFSISDFAKQMAEIEAGCCVPVIHVGNLDSKRDFIDVRDLVRAYVLLLQRGESGEVYNVGSGNAVSIKEILELILEKGKASVEVKVDSDRIRPLDVPIVHADIKKLEKATGWKRKISLEESIQDMLEYWRNNI